MAQAQLSIISNSTGKFRTEIINGREHLVTSMVSLEGDSVMNELFYPNAEVSKALPQLNNLPAPAGHPQVDGEFVSAHNLLAMNKHSFGAMVANPRQEGKRVINDLVIDIEVANRTTEGKQVIERIKNKQRIGVSTGLNAEINNNKGTANNKQFNGSVMNIKFDHVAVLLNEPPAGDSTYTINHKLIKPTQTRGRNMDNILQLNMVALSLADKQFLESMSATEIVNQLRSEPSIDDAKKVIEKEGLFVNAATEAQVSEFIANKSDFEQFKQQRVAARQEKCDFITNNSKNWSSEQLENLDDTALDSLVNSVAPKNNFQINGTPVREVELEMIKV